jgi:endonuclease/exonuclease/phosphatase (EEP) superfamily protein YafD
VLALLRSYGFALLALLAAVVNLALVALIYLPAPDPSRYDSRNLRVLFAHLDRTSADYDAVASLVRKEDPDLVVFNEVSREWLAGLDPLNAAYPHRVAVPRDDEHGLAIYSQLPLSETVSPTLGTLGLPAIATRAMLDDIPITMITAHPPMPMTGDLAAERNRQFDELATLARSRQAPAILCGDLSTSPWSPFFVDLLDGTGLLNSRQGHGLEATWNASWPRLMTLPIDHCLTSPDIAVLALRRGPRVGSDHLPLLVDLAVSKP